MKPRSACHDLQNKAWFCGPEPERSEEEEFTTPFWCLKTHDACGPDGGEVAVRRCCPGRPCYRPEVEL